MSQPTMAIVDAAMFAYPGTPTVLLELLRMGKGTDASPYYYYIVRHFTGEPERLPLGTDEGEARTSFKCMATAMEDAARTLTQRG